MTWLQFLKQYYNKHKASGKSYKECMKLAAVEWKKKKKGGKKNDEAGGKLRKKKDQIVDEKPPKKKRRRVRKK